MPFKRAASRLFATGLAATLAFGASAFDVSNMTEEERAAFGTEVRSYLLENPEILIEVMDVLEARQAQAQTASDATLISSHEAEIFSSPDDHVFGNPDGDIVMVEFLDYRCGYCKKAAPDVARLLKTDGNIKLIVKEFPILGDQSVLASRFAIATKMVEGEEAYAELHHTLMDGGTNISEASLRRVGERLDLDTDAIFAKVDSDEVSAIIEKNHKLASLLQISGTPSFVVEDSMLRGYMPYDGMVQMIAELRSQ